MTTKKLTNPMSQQTGRLLNTRLLETNLASRWKRLGGILIDGFVSLVIFLPIMLVTGGQEQMLNGQQLTIGQQVAFFVVGRD